MKKRGVHYPLTIMGIILIFVLFLVLIKMPPKYKYSNDIFNQDFIEDKYGIIDGAQINFINAGLEVEDFIIVNGREYELNKEKIQNVLIRKETTEEGKKIMYGLKNEDDEKEIQFVWKSRVSETYDRANKFSLSRDFVSNDEVVKFYQNDKYESFMTFEDVGRAFGGASLSYSAASRLLVVSSDKIRIGKGQEIILDPGVAKAPVQVPDTSSFDGETSDFEVVLDPSHAKNVVLEKTSYGKIQYTDTIGINGNLEKNVIIEKNKIGINSEEAPELNSPAVLSIYGSFDNPVVFENGVPCYGGQSHCKILKNTGNEVDFNVDHFSNYSLENAVNITGCQVLDQQDTVYALANDIEDDTLTGDCITIAASNVTLDCMGHFIKSNGDYSGIYSDQSLTIVANCNITMGTGYGGNGIELIDADDSLIINNILNGQNRGLVMRYVERTITEGVTANNNGFGFYIAEDSNNNIFRSNTADYNTGGSGFSLFSSSSNFIVDSTANYNNNQGVWLTDASTNNTLITLVLTNNNYGVLVGYSTANNNNTIKNIIANNNEGAGIIITISPGNVITNNTVKNNGGYGIDLYGSSKNTIRYNNMSNNTYNFMISGTDNKHFMNIIDTTNTIDYNYKLYYNFSVSNYIYDEITTPDAGTIICANCDYLSVKGLNLSHHSYDGLFFFNTTNSMVENITTNSNYYGIRLTSSADNNVRGSSADSNQYGISLSYSMGNSLENNDIRNCLVKDVSGCLSLYNSENNKIAGGILDLSASNLIYIRDSDNNIFQDMTLYNAQNNDTYLSLNSENITFINVSYDNSREYVDPDSELIRKWYYRAYVNDTLGGDVSGANVSIYNVSGNYMHNMITGASGYTDVYDILEYINDGTAISYYSDYTINATHASYPSVAHSYDVGAKKNNLKDVFTLSGGNLSGISFAPPTPPDGATTADYAEINVSIMKPNLDEVRFNWDGADFTLYNDSLILMFNFDNRSELGEDNSKVVDVYGQRYNGTPTIGAVVVDGKAGSARSMTGTADYINIPAVNMNGDRTISVWSYFPLYVTGSYRTLFQKQGGTYHHILVDVNGYIGIYNGAWYSSGFDTDTLAEGWHHIVARGSGGQTQFYVDGEYVGTSSSQVVQDLSRIGNHNSGQTWGIFDEIRIYNIALSADDIKQLYFSSLNKYNSDAWNLYVYEGIPEPKGYINHSYSACAADGALEECTETRTLSVVGINPAVEFTPPTPSNGESLSQNYVEINVSINEPNLDNAGYNWDGFNFTLFDDSLILMYNFENISALGESNTKVVDMSGKRHDGTVVGDPINQIGKYGGGYEGDGTNGKDINTHLGNAWNPSINPISFSMWVSPDVNNNDMYFGSSGGTTNRFYFGVYGGYWRMGVQGSSWSAAGTGTDLAVALNKWVLVTVVMNGTGANFYLDGEFYNYKAYTSFATGGEFYVGAYGSSTGYNWDGKIYDVMVWNRILVADEIKQLYFMSLQKYDTDEWALYINQSKNPEEDLDDGTYAYYIYAKDDAGNENVTETRTVTIDPPSPPMVTLNYPENGTGSMEPTIGFNCSATDTNGNTTLSNITFYWDASGSFVANGSVPLYGEYDSASFIRSDMPQKVISWNCYACDTNGNCGFSEHNNIFTFYQLGVTDCTVLNQPDTVYTLTNSISNNDIADNRISITAPNITLDCAGHSITSDQDYTGVYSNQPFTTIKNCDISMGTYGGYGIYLSNADNSIILNNILHNQRYGLVIRDDTSNTLVQNIVANNNDDYGIYVYQSPNNIFDNVSSNLNYYGFLVSSSSYTTISNTESNNNSYYGFYLYSGSYSTFNNARAMGNRYYGFEIHSYDNNFNNVAAKNNDRGFYLYYGGRNNYTNLTAVHNNYGLYFISGNNIINNSRIN
jgi:parallel beta-helix repeat protein